MPSNPSLETIPSIIDQSALPVAEQFSYLVDQIGSHSQLILQAEPGAGKTSLYPIIALYDIQKLKQASTKSAQSVQNKQIILVTPRRLAARNAANRLAELLSSSIGEGLVGFKTGAESKTSDNNQIVVMTEAIAVKVIQSDPECSDIAHIIFDEFHERNIGSDLGLMLARDVQMAFNDSLKITVMSATLDMQSLNSFLPDATSIPIAGRQFPVEIDYCANGNQLSPELHIANVVKSLLATEQRDILIFLDGIKSIEQSKHALENANLGADIAIHCLHSSIDWKTQKAIIQYDGTNKETQRIILTTNIAETSLTIANIGTVIDSGLMRTSIYEGKSDSTRLLTTTIAGQNAIQRAGRAGRLQSGHCIRLWSKDKTLAKYHQPEIVNTDLKPIILELALWGHCNYQSIDWLTAPSQIAFERAQSVLRDLGALNTDNQITHQGKLLLQLGCDVKLAKLLINSAGTNWFQPACELVFALQENITLPSEIDLHDAALRIHIPKRLNQQYQRKLAQWKQCLCKAKSSNFESLSQAICDAFIHCVGKKTTSKDGKPNYKLANGVIASSFAESKSNSEFIIALNLRKHKAGYAMQYTINLNADDVAFIRQHHESNDIQLVSAGEKIQAKRVQRIAALILEQQSLPIDNVPDLHRKLHDFWIETIQQRIENKQLFTGEFKSLFAQSELLKSYGFEPESDAISYSRAMETWQDWLLPIIESETNLAPLESKNLIQLFLQSVDWSVQKSIESLLPKKIDIPSGRSVAINYQFEPPRISAKLQELFGQNNNLSILNGQLTLTIELLSPAQKPLQLTSDLQSFWKNAYQEVKKEMKGRYPKHPWPDDPLNAIASAKTKKQLKS